MSQVGCSVAEPTLPVQEQPFILLGQVLVELSNNELPNYMVSKHTICQRLSSRTGITQLILTKPSGDVTVHTSLQEVETTELTTKMSRLPVIASAWQEHFKGM